MKRILSIPLENIDVAVLGNGVYKGNYSQNDVEVIIAAHKI